MLEDRKIESVFDCDVLLCKFAVEKSLKTPVVYARSVCCKCGRWTVCVYRTDFFTDGGSDRSEGIRRHQEARSSCGYGYHGQSEIRRAHRARRSGPGHQQGGGEHRSAPGKPIICLYCFLVAMVISYLIL